MNTSRHTRLTERAERAFANSRRSSETANRMAAASSELSRQAKALFESIPSQTPKRLGGFLRNLSTLARGRLLMLRSRWLLARSSGHLSAASVYLKLGQRLLEMQGNPGETESS